MAISMNDVQEADDIGVVHFLEERDLSDRRAGYTLIFGFEADFLQGHDTGRMCKIACLVDNAVGT